MKQETKRNVNSTIEREDVPMEIEELEMQIVPTLRLIVAASAEMSPYKDIVSDWLKRVKFALYDAEDLLDEYAYEQIERQIRENRFMECLPPHPFIDHLEEFLDKVSRKLPQILSLRTKLTRLRSVATQAISFYKLLETQTVSMDRSIPTTSKLHADIFGLNTEREALIRQMFALRNGNESGSSTTIRESFVFAIVGIPGIGKSTLARYIFNDKRVENHFASKIWISISRKLDIVQHTKDMINSVPNGNCPETENLNILQEELQYLLLDKKSILLVLDDIWWNQSEVDLWEQMLAPFTSYPGKVTILLTSRSKNLPYPLHTENVTVLTGLNKGNISLLFKKYAFSHADAIMENDTQELESISDKIIDKLGGSPGIAITIGRRLSKNLDANLWRRVADGKNFNDATDSLLWSYQQLDQRARRCFRYCSVFPKGHKFVITDLVQMWMAQGFVEDKYMGRTYFHELLSACFFQVEVQNGGRELFKLHDLFHDLAEKLSKGDCYRIEDEKVTEIPPTVCYLSIQGAELKKHKSNIDKLKHLRTLIFLEPCNDDMTGSLEEILSNVTKLRVLYLNCYDINKLTELLGNLKHLRYLNVALTAILEIPESLCKLYNLQVLKFNERVTSLPKNIHNLTKLRHIEAYNNNYEIQPVPPIHYIGKLTSLKHLETFHVGTNEAFALRQLKNLNGLHGSLKITDLENVESKEEAIDACLHEKMNVTELHLSWSIDHKENLCRESAVLEALVPPPRVKFLTIEGYGASTLPSLRSLACLQRLVIDSCPGIIALPDLPESLRFIEINNCPALKERCQEPDGENWSKIAHIPQKYII